MLKEYLTEVIKNSVVKQKHYILTCSRQVASFEYISSTRTIIKHLECEMRIS